eukprot:m.395169 g.395169  ORF g.395169 m.395169 type:complete len:174 (-) comp56387_c0_seq1:136-657(-)
MFLDKRWLTFAWRIHQRTLPSDCLLFSCVLLPGSCYDRLNSLVYRLRDFVDTQRAVSQLDVQTIAALGAVEGTEAIRKPLKLYKQQARRVHEILRLRSLGNSSAERREFRLFVKTRLIQHHLKSEKELNSLSEAELELYREQQSRLKDDLQEEYVALETAYQRVLDRLAARPS